MYNYVFVAPFWDSKEQTKIKKFDALLQGKKNVAKNCDRA